MSDDLRARMSESDAAHWDEIQRWKDTQMRPIRPRVISQRVRSAALAPLGKAVSIARKVPGGEALTRTVSSAALGLVELAASASEASVRRKRILKAYRSVGFDVRTLQDIRSLRVDDVLAVKPRLSLAYSTTAAAEGAVSGVFASGGSVAAVLGMGVASAPGVGVTASAIIEVGPASYVGVERDPNASARVDAIASGVGHCVNADAAQTGLPDESADVVVGEAILSMQGEKAKRAIMSEAARILRPGGRYVIHELAMRPDTIPEEPATEIRRALARAINVNARPLTVADWRRALEDVGLVVEETRTAPMALLKPGRMIADEGVRGALRIMRNVARDKDLRERVQAMARTFKKYDRHLCGVAIVARKPKEGQ